MTTLGRHALLRTDDILELQFVGPLTRDDVAELRATVQTVMAEHGTCYVIGDMRNGTGIDADARKYLAQWSKERSDNLSGCAVYGVSGPMRAILKLTLAAIKVLGTQQVELEFVKDDAAARQWIAAQRGLTASSAP